MQLCKYIYELAYTQEFNGNVKGKQVSSKMITLNSESFIATATGKAIWVKISGKKKDIRFSLPVSQMFNIKKLQFKGKPHIVFEMTKGMHNSATWGKKDANGKRIFKSKKSAFNCANYSPIAGSNVFVGQSGSSGTVSTGGRSI